MTRSLFSLSTPAGTEELMKKINLFLSIGIACFSWSAFAHDQDNTLNPSASATDTYQVHCFDDGQGGGPAAKLEVELLTTSKSAPIVSLQVKTTAESIPFTITNITDPVNGDKGFSRTIAIANNSATPYTQVDTTHNANGYYYISVNKTKVGKQSYHFSYHCVGANDHTGTEITLLQKDAPK